MPPDAVDWLRAALERLESRLERLANAQADLHADMCAGFARAEVRVDSIEVRLTEAERHCEEVQEGKAGDTRAQLALRDEGRRHWARTIGAAGIGIVATVVGMGVALALGWKP